MVRLWQTVGVILLVWSTGIYGERDSRNSGPENDDETTFRVYSGDTFHEARDRCFKEGGQLPVMQTNSSNQRLAKVMTSHGIQTTWLGATVGRYPWKWVSDMSVLEDQGCYLDPQGPPGQTGDRASFPQLSVDSCIRHCREQGTMFMAIQVPDVCECTDEFHARGPAHTARCEESCPGDGYDLCGSPGYVRVFSTDREASRSPVDWDDRGDFNDSACVGMTNSQAGLVLNSKNCLEKHPFMCDIPIDDTARCRLSLGDKCVAVFDEPRTWFGARQHCLQAGGDLAKTDKHYRKAWVFASFSNLLQRGDVYWLGLTAVHLAWFTSDVNLSPPAVEKAMQGGDMCLVLHSSGLYTREPCSKNHGVLCQFGKHDLSLGKGNKVEVSSSILLRPPSNLDTSTERSSIEDVFSTTVGVPPGGLGEKGSSIAHNSAASSSAPLAEIALGVVLGLVLLSLLICILIFCTRRRRRKKDEPVRQNGRVPVGYHAGKAPEMENALNESQRSRTGNGCAYVPNYYSSSVPMPYIDEELVPVFNKDAINPSPNNKTNSYRSFTGSFYDNVPLWDTSGYSTLPRCPSSSTRNSTRTLPVPAPVDEDGKPVLVCYMRTRSLFDLVRSSRKSRRKTFSCGRRLPEHPVVKRFSWSEERTPTAEDDDSNSTQDSDGATWV